MGIKKSEKGFTLMEAVLAVSLLALVSVTSLGVVVNVLRSATKSQAGVDTEQAAGFVLSNLEDDAKKSTSARIVSGDLELTGPSFYALYRLSSPCPGNLALLNCVTVNRGSGVIKLTDDTYDTISGIHRPRSSSVTVYINASDPTNTSYFSVIPSTGTPLAVNVKIKFQKPDPTGPGIFRAETTLDTTIELGDINR